MSESLMFTELIGIEHSTSSTSLTCFFPDEDVYDTKEEYWTICFSCADRIKVAKNLVNGVIEMKIFIESEDYYFATPDGYVDDNVKIEYDTTKTNKYGRHIKADQAWFDTVELINQHIVVWFESHKTYDDREFALLLHAIGCIFRASVDWRPYDTGL